MKKLFLFLILTLFFSCIDEVTLDLKNNENRLVIDANIDWIIGTTGTEQQIIITKSANFYDKDIPIVKDAKVKIIDDLGQVFIFKYIEDGVYKCYDFIPFVGRKYQLHVEYQGEKYFAENTLLKTPVLDVNKVTQKEDGGVFGNSLEFKAFFQDEEKEQNYYLFKYKEIPSDTTRVKTKIQPNYQVIPDKFFNGKQMFGIYTSEEDDNKDKLKKDDTLNIRLKEITKESYNFYRILFDQTGNAGSGNAFGTVPANARGNIVNTTNKDNYPYGYFQLSLMSEIKYAVK